MPRILFRALIIELLRVGVLTTLILVTVIAFGAAVKPLSQDSLLTGGQVVKYIALACIPMLQFALPFAAGFAGTMTLHRMTTDNEVLAMAGSGISYWRMLAPAVALGLGLTVIMVGLTQTVIPRFWSKLDETLARDVGLLLQSSIARGEPFEAGDLQIWADEIVSNPEPASGADTRLHLFRVAVVDLDDDGRIAADVTAEQVIVDFYRFDDRTELHLVMDDAVAYKPSTGVLAGVDRQEARIALANVLEESPNWFTRGELIALRANPDLLARVDRIRVDLAKTLRMAELPGLIDERLRRDGVVDLVGAGDRRFQIVADSMAGRRFFRSGDPVIQIREIEHGAVTRIYETRRAKIAPYSGTPLQAIATGLTVGRTVTAEALHINLDLGACTWSDVDVPDSSNQLASLVLERLSIEGYDGLAVMELTSDELLARGAPLRASSPAFETMAAKIEQAHESTRWEIHGRLFKRYALSMTAMLLLVLGSSMAMTMRDSTPLAIYLWAFLPSVINLILISSGEHMMRDGNLVTGALVLWGGNGILLAMIGMTYWKLSRN